VIGKDGSYHVKAKRPEESLFQLAFDTDNYPLAIIINDVSSIKLNADLNQRNNYDIQGSPASQSLKDFSISASNRWAEIFFLRQQMDSLKNAGAPDSVLVLVNNKGNALWHELQNAVKKFVQNSPNPVSCVWALGTYYQVISPDDYQQLLDEVVKKFPDNKGIAAIKEMNDRQKELAKQKAEPDAPSWIGKEAPQLSLPDVNGKEITLSSFRGKYVLVDFWASWCGPCRRENPNLVEAYNKYKNKNFTVLGVSLDEEKSEWLKAVQKDGLAWTQVSDLKQWNSKAVSIFNFNSIPFNVLVDPEGKIIAQSLRGYGLESKLGEVLK
jgi:peroxiredoxin